MSAGTYIDGIASSQAIDTAGEVVSIQGMDITSLVGSVFNYEHKSDVPAQIVGKILYAKKIFEEGDCENDRQKKCWASCKLPFLYVMGQLFDDYAPSAQEIAGVFMYDSHNKNQLPTLGFSIEGSKISKEGMVVNRSIARKVTITVAPANKTCLAEVVTPDEGQGADDLSSIFKTEYSVDMIKAEEAADILGIPMNKSEDYKKGSVIGKTGSGKEVYSHGPIHAAGFDIQDHKDAADLHLKATKTPGDAKKAQHHYDKYKLHNQAVVTQTSKLERMKATAPKTTAPTAAPSGAPGYGKLFDPRLSGSSVKKSATANDGLGKEDLDKKMHKAEKPKLIGSTGSKEDMVKHLSKHFYGANISLHDQRDGTHAVHNSKGKIDGLHVREHKGRWRAEHSPADLKKAAQIPFNGDGLNQGTSKKGVSHQGEMVREGDLASAKVTSKMNLASAKQTPKPNLTKARVDEGKSDHEKAVARTDRNVRYKYDTHQQAKGMGGSSSASWEKGHVPAAGKKGEKVSGHSKFRGNDDLHCYGDYEKGTSKAGAKEAHNRFMSEVQQTKFAKNPKPSLAKKPGIGAKIKGAVSGMLKKPLAKTMYSGAGERIPARDLQKPNLRADAAKAKTWKAGGSTKELAGTSIGQGEDVRNGDMANAKDAAQRSLNYERRLPKPKLTKSEMLERAEKAYQAWGKRSDFEKFMSDRLPNLAKGEIVAMGQAIALKQSIEEENELAELVNYEIETPKK